jgi:hypothetical protein
VHEKDAGRPRADTAIGGAPLARMLNHAVLSAAHKPSLTAFSAAAGRSSRSGIAGDASASRRDWTERPCECKYCTRQVQYCSCVGEPATM